MNEEPSNKEIIIKCKKLLKYLQQKWRIIILPALFLGLVGYYVALKKTVSYEVYSSFGVEGKGGGMQSTALTIASQLGFPLGGSGVFPDNKMLMGIITSRRAIKSSLLKPYQGVSLANRYIKLYMPSVVEPIKSMNIKDLSRKEDSVLDLIYENCNKQLISVNLDEDVGLVRMKVESIDKDFSIELSTNLINFLNSFFIDNQNKEEKTNFDIAKKKTDSVYYALKNKEEMLAQYNDSHGRTTKFQGKLEQASLSRDVFILTKMYAEAAANLEMTKYAMLNNKTILFLVDEPLYCLKIVRANKLKMAILFALVWLFLATVFFGVVNYIKEEQ